MHAKIVFLAFMIISYALFVYGFMVDERTLYMASFIAFTVFLLVFVLLFVFESLPLRNKEVYIDNVLLIGMCYYNNNGFQSVLQSYYVLFCI